MKRVKVAVMLVGAFALDKVIVVFPVIISAAAATLLGLDLAYDSVGFSLLDRLNMQCCTHRRLTVMCARDIAWSLA